MNDCQVLDCNVTFLTRNWPKYCKQPYLSEIPHAAETKYFTRDKICQDFALLQSVWSPPDRSSFLAILMVGHKCGHPDGAGERGRFSDAEGWGGWSAVWQYGAARWRVRSLERKTTWIFRLHSPCVASGEQSTQTLHLGLVWDDLCSLSFLCHVRSGYWPDMDHYKLALTWRNPSVWIFTKLVIFSEDWVYSWEIL